MKSGLSQDQVLSFVSTSCRLYGINKMSVKVRPALVVLVGSLILTRAIGSTVSRQAVTAALTSYQTKHENASEPNTFSVEPSTPIEPATSTCAAQCLNGIDRGECTQNCSCSVGGLPFYTGSACEIVNLGVTYQNTSARTLNITWPSPPLIAQEQYLFVYKNNGTVPLDPNSHAVIEASVVVIDTAPLDMIEATIARLINLHKTTRYIICVMESSQAETIQAENDVEALNPSMQDCVYVETTDNVIWPYTLAAFIIAGLMIVIIIGLIVAKLISDRSLNNKEIYYERKRKRKAKKAENASACKETVIQQEIYIEDIESDSDPCDVRMTGTSTATVTMNSEASKAVYVDTAKSASYQPEVLQPGSGGTQWRAGLPVGELPKSDQAGMPADKQTAYYLQRRPGDHDPGVTVGYSGPDQSGDRQSSSYSQPAGKYHIDSASNWKDGAFYDQPENKTNCYGNAGGQRDQSEDKFPEVDYT